MSQLTFSLVVVMERSPTANRWVTHQWAAHAVLPASAVGAAPQVMLERDGLRRVAFPPMETSVYADEAEGYFLNLTSPTPCVFVCWRMPDSETDEGDATPHRLTLSYNEAARWMDAQERVDRVSLPDEIHSVLGEWVAQNYTPPMKKNRIRPNSFKSKDGRYDGGIRGGADAPKPEGPAS